MCSLRMSDPSELMIKPHIQWETHLTITKEL